MEQTCLGQEHPLWAGATFSLWCLLRMRSDPARRAPSHCHQYPSGKLTAGTCEMRRFEGNPLSSILNFQVLGSFWGVHLQRTIRLSSAKGNSMKLLSSKTCPSYRERLPFNILMGWMIIQFPISSRFSWYY